ncbi:cobyrinate a,c-diamide synthase [Lusitaniella coriacea]|uniref:cobyrinate a,c-diamide synthase n=1 Tax=Lusitaniella coriacea TaxID=1983105 RepID=UPI003CF9F2BD
MSIVIAGERSGAGKTTVTLALLSFLSQQRVQSFKVGPDYIDPMFHTATVGRPCRNLDPVLTSEDYVRQCFHRHCQDADYGIVEGVMGLFDGIARTASFPAKDFASTAHIARLLDLPILLILDCRRLSHSVAAIAHGYSTLDPRLKIAGLILNRVGSERHRELLTEALEPLGIPILGILHRHDEITIPDRHLGLVPTEELPELEHFFMKLASLAQKSFDWDRLLPLLKVGKVRSPKPPTYREKTVRIAIARDRAFNFYYPDNLDLLEQLGAELIPWSPLSDSQLPPNIQGLYFGGGFPEVFAQPLSENQTARNAVRTTIQGGIPTYAECGGLMYLCENLIDFDGQSRPMAGVLHTTTRMSPTLTLGYRQATALQNSPILNCGETLWGHEFHRSQLSTNAPHPLYQIQNPPIAEGWQIHQLHASYIHLHWGARPSVPQRFLQFCSTYQNLGV